MSDRLEFVANLCDRQSALMLSGKGDRCLVELEAFGLNAILAHVGMAKFAGRGFRVIIEELEIAVKEEDELPDRTIGRTTAKRRK